MEAPTSKQRHPRICLLTESFHPVVGGGEGHARRLAAELARRGAGVVVVTRRRSKSHAAKERLDRFDVFRVPPSGRQRLGKYLMTLPAFLRLIALRRRYDIIYVCGMRVLGVVAAVAARLMRKKTVMRSESCGELSGEFALPGGLPGIAAATIRLLLRWRNGFLLAGDRFLAISDVIRDEYIRGGVPRGKIDLVPNGIDTDLFRPVDAETKKALRAKLSLPDGPLFVYTGKLNRGKGLELLLEVWARIAPRKPAAHLCLVGSGELQALGCEEELRRYVTENRLADSVTFAGQVDHVHHYLQAADFFVIASEEESQCISLVEALACGLPSVATAAGGMVDIVEDGVNGTLVPVGDGGRLERAMLAFMEKPQEAEKLGVRGRETVLERYGMEKDVEDHMELFRKVARAPSP
jgi:glycosyltransferase involved in cell wall biosynthesis